MYATFKKEMGQGRESFRAGEEELLFGRRAGWLPWLLQDEMDDTSPRQCEPYPWHVNIQTALLRPSIRERYPNVESIVVDIKPKAKDNFLVCELQDVYGYSDDGWTPLLWRMRQLPSVSKLKRKGGRGKYIESFDAPLDGDSAYVFLYTRGSVEDGRISGDWMLPGPSAANGVLLLPDVMAYFIECIAGRSAHATGA